MKKKQSAVASLETFCGDFGVFIFRYLEKFVCRIIRPRILIFDGNRQTSVTLQRFANFKNGHAAVLELKIFFKTFLRCLNL